MLKQLLPKPLKQILWKLFKAPQRKWVGYATIWTDLRGLLSIWSKPAMAEPISVCVGVKNRSRHLLTHLVGSLNRCERKDLIELSVYDCGSDDVPDLEGMLRNAWKGKLVYHRQEQPFARTISFNAAVQQSGSDLILICDADMSVPHDIVKKVNRCVTRRAAWFPEVRYMNADGSSRYYTESTGMFASRKQDFIRAGRLDENIREWGKEDWLLFFAFYKEGIACLRTREPDFVHHYHPSLKPDGFIPLF